MDENSSMTDQVLRLAEDEEQQRLSKQNSVDESDGWQTVTYHKRHRRQSRAPQPADPRPSNPDVFLSVELHYEQCRRRALAASANGENLHHKEDGDDGGNDPEAAPATVENGNKGVQRAKRKKPKQPKVTVAEAAAKMDAADLSAYLVDVTVSKHFDGWIL